jgi:hypothetical protein
MRVALRVTTLLLSCSLWPPAGVEGRRRKKLHHAALADEDGPAATSASADASFPLWQPPTDGATVYQDEGSEYRLRRLASSPSVFMVDDFLDSAACERLIELALDSPTLAESEVNWKVDSDLSDGNAAWRRSSSAFLAKEGKAMDPAVAELNAKVSRLTRVPEAALARGNSLQIGRYRPGEHYWPHYDSRHLKDLGEEAFVKLLEAGGGGAARLTSGMLSAVGFPYAARYATVLLFLRTASRGGNTTFPLVSSSAVDEPTGPVQAQTDLLSSKNRDAHTYAGFGASTAHLARLNDCPVSSVDTIRSFHCRVCWDRIWRQHSATCEHGLSVAPRQGSALLWYNHKLSTASKDGSPRYSTNIGTSFSERSETATALKIRAMVRGCKCDWTSIRSSCLR